MAWSSREVLRLLSVTYNLGVLQLSQSRHPGLLLRGQRRASAREPCRPTHRRYACVMRPLRYSINVTLDGCCDHRAIPADEELHRHAIENLDQADALLFGRVTYEMMEAAFRPRSE